MRVECPIAEVFELEDQVFLHGIGVGIVIGVAILAAEIIRIICVHGDAHAGILATSRQTPLGRVKRFGGAYTGHSVGVQEDHAVLVAGNAADGGIAQAINLLRAVDRKLVVRMWISVPASESLVRLVEHFEAQPAGLVREVTCDASPEVPKLVLVVLGSIVAILQPVLVVCVYNHVEAQAQSIVDNFRDLLCQLRVRIEMSVPRHRHANVSESFVVSPLDLSLDNRGVAVALVEIVHVPEVDPSAHVLDRATARPCLSVALNGSFPLD
mmetsp:Transcript_113879/g.159723  ORF Transcript_113879/g.159723 Transcript_113879/m.159723 type:complete len:268 (-) Transcript_113879:252-1055(-)